MVLIINDILLSFCFFENLRSKVFEHIIRLKVFIFYFLGKSDKYEIKLKAIIWSRESSS